MLNLGAETMLKMECMAICRANVLSQNGEYTKGDFWFKDMMKNSSNWSSPFSAIFK